MNIKEFRQVLTVMSDWEPNEIRDLCNQAKNNKVSDEDFEKRLEPRLSKVTRPGPFPFQK